MSSVPLTNVSASSVRSVFGGTTPGPVRLSQYYTNATEGYTAGVSGIPQIGFPISFGQLRGKSKPVWGVSTSVTLTSPNYGYYGPTTTDVNNVIASYPVLSTFAAADTVASTVMYASYGYSMRLTGLPAGVYEIECRGAGGGGADPGTGGTGGRIKARFDIVSTDILYCTVGQGGLYANASSDYVPGGFNGGGALGGIAGSHFSGAGGGASDVRINGKNLSNRIIVGGGGGGSGDDGNGGNGGGTSGVAGSTGTTAGRGGTQTAGGAGGVCAANGTSGAAGTLGNGGDGNRSNNDTTSNNNAVGGGGGGYYGGGGGGDEPSGGGGGGSSWAGGVKLVSIIENVAGGGGTGGSNTVTTGGNFSTATYQTSPTTFYQRSGSNGQITITRIS